MLVSKHALDTGRDVAIYSLPMLLAKIRGTFRDDSEGTYVELLDKLASIDLLHIDDLGAANSSSWVLEALYAIINARYEEQRSVIVTHSPTKRRVIGKDGNEREEVVELAEQIGARTVSRLEEMCEVLPLYGADQRQQTYGLRPV